MQDNNLMNEMTCNFDFHNRSRVKLPTRSDADFTAVDNWTEEEQRYDSN